MKIAARIAQSISDNHPSLFTSMSPERWQHIRELFLQTHELTPDERKTVLDGACPDDHQLRSEVESLLASHDAAGDILEPLHESIVATVVQNTREPERIGTVLGSYRIVRLVAHGGMGEVYEAVRDDGKFQKRVAIKLVRLGLSREELLRRFEAERRLLASLTHPNVAQLIDAGTTDDGIPYIMIEFVDGRRIDEYCDEQKLTIEERLILFRTVCSAVQYAHQHLVVHRDIKPGNILVTPDGIPKLLDFGIAKLITEDSTGEDATRTGSGFMTPEYASPEQIRGDKVTTISDVYSLGVLLYKLLTGQKPYEFKSGVPFDISRTIVETEPTKPSANAVTIITRTDKEEKIRRQLSGDVDAIVLMALRKEPHLRYQSVRELSEDISRYLQHLPVAARMGAGTYRMRKFIRRHWKSAIAASVAVLAVLGGIAGVVWEAQKTKRERDHAQAEAEKAQQVVSVLNDIFSAADNSQSTQKDVTVAQVLDKATKRIEAEFGRQPEIAADVLATIGSTYEGLGLFDKAESADRRVLELRKQVFGAEHPKVAAALHQIALVLDWKEKARESDSVYTLSLAMFARFGQPSRDYAEALNDYGVFVQEQERYAQADSLFTASLSMHQGQPGDNRRDIATSVNNLALNKDWEKDYAAADSLYRVSLRIMREAYGNDNAQTAITLSNIALTLEEQGKQDEAERILRESLAIMKKTLGESHTDVVAGKVTLASHLTRYTSNYAEAEQLDREALASLQSEHPQLKRLAGKVYLGLGEALQKQGRFAESEQNLRKAAEIFSHMEPANTRELAKVEQALAENKVRRKGR